MKTFVKGMAIMLMVAAVVKMLPDIARYMKIRAM
jgi:hypothetical protein